MSAQNTERTYRMVISCPDQVGIVASVAQMIADQGGWLTEAKYHSDAEHNWFFMRNEIQADSFEGQS
jgi:formyltetrahydrofolate deformylase